MDDAKKNEENKPVTKQQSKNKFEEIPDSENGDEFDPLEITDQQKIEQDSFYNQFADFSPIKIPIFLFQEYENRLTKNIELNSTLFQEIYQFYKNEHQNAEKIKNKILLRLNDFQYSMNRLPIISKFFQSYSSFQNFCVSGQIILSNQNYPNPPYQIFERSILLNILNTNRNLTLNNLLFKFKYFPLIRRKEILTTAVERYIFSIKKEDTSIPILTKTKEHVLSELSRLSKHLGITYDLESYDGQLFKYSCETILSEYQRLKFSFKIIPVSQPKPVNLTDRMNGAFMETFSKDSSITESFNNILQPNETYRNDLADSLMVKKFQRDLIVSWVSLRFCRNRQLLSNLEKAVDKLFEWVKKIYEICRLDLNTEQRTFCDKYISFVVEQILVFSSVVYVKSGKKADVDPIIEISIEKFLRFTEAKVKILALLAEIAKHSNSEKVVDLAESFIEKRPNLIFQNFSFFELFDVQIETLEMEAKCLSLIVNVQILNERQLTAFYGSFFEPYQFGTFYSNEGEGEFNISNFEVYLSIEKVLDFISFSPKIVDELCTTMSIKAVDYSDYLELGVWTQLFEEITEFPDVSVFGTDFPTVRFNLPFSKDVESLINCQLLNDPLFVREYIHRIDQSKSEFSQNLTKFTLLAFKLRSLVYKTNLFLTLYLRQYQEVNSTTGSPKNVDFVGKSFNFSDYDEIQKVCLNGDFSNIIEIVNNQKRYNMMLMIAVQHNNFRSDNEHISILFNLTKPDNLFTFTKAETTVDEDMKFYKEAARRFFVGFESFYEQDFGSIFFDISSVNDFSDTKSLLSTLKKYLFRIELATITNCERILLNDFQQIELFTLDSNFYRPEDGFVDYFSIPGTRQCLIIDADNLESIVNLAAIRLQLISFIRFSFFLKNRLTDPYIVLYNRKVNFESSFLSKLNSSAHKSVDEAKGHFKSGCLLELGRFLVAILQILQKNFTSKKETAEKSKSATVDEIRNLWKIVNQEYDKKFINSAKFTFSHISVERYIPMYLSRFNFKLSNEMNNDLQNQFRAIDKQVNQTIIFKDAVNPETELGEYMGSEIVNELLKFCLLRLQSNSLYSDLNVISLVDITRSEYKENIHFYSNFFSVPGKPRLPKLIENKLLKQPITTVINKSQKKRNEELFESDSEKLKVFDSINSLLKPDIYIKKTNIENQKLQPYNPTPENAQIQFDQEMRFANSKIISLIIQGINNSIIADKRMIFNTNSKIELKLDTNNLITNLSPLSYYLTNFVQISPKQDLKTWLSYTEIMKQITFAYDQGEILERLFKEKFQYTQDFQMSCKYFDDLIKLSRLREIEKATNKEQMIFILNTTKQIRDEFENELLELEKEREEKMKEYRVIHNKLFSLTDNIIAKQKDKIPENEKILQPNNAEAQKSIEQSKKEGFTLEADDNIRNEVFSSSSSIEEEKKKEEEDDDMEEFPSFNRNTSHDDSLVRFPTFQPPPRVITGATMRRNTMIRPGARALLQARQNIEQLRAKEKEEKEEKTNPMNEIKKHIEKSKEKYKEIENDLPEIRKTILKLRITRCLFRIGTSKNFKKNKNTLSREKKEVSTVFWSNRKTYEEDFREKRNKIDHCFDRLLKAEIESENLKNELTEVKKVTTKLLHWKDLNLKTSDQILKEISKYEKGPNVDVNLLLKKLDHKRAELDALYMDEESFETDIYYKVRQPLEEISRVRRFVNSEQYNYMKSQQIKSENEEEREDEENQVNDLFDENLKLKIENKRLKTQIFQLEQNEQNENQTPQIDDNKKSTELPQLPSARRIRSSYISQSRRPPLRPRSLYSNYGYRTIRKP